MLTQRISRTALRNAVLRALESQRPRKECLFEDPFARGFLNFRYRAVLKLLLFPRVGKTVLVKRELKYPGMIGNFLCRTRYIDDVLSNALEKGVDQVVFLGAGFDSRPYRLPKIDRTRVFEVDHPALQSLKIERLARMLSKLPEHVTFVPIDFDRQSIEEMMTKVNFNPEKKTFFIWEGVTQYISAEAVDAIFLYVSRVASPESSLLFTYINRGIIEGNVSVEHSKALMAHHERLGEPWIYGIDPAEISLYLSERGFIFVEQVGASEYRERYLRPLNRQMNIFDGECVALAQIKGGRGT